MFSITLNVYNQSGMLHTRQTARETNVRGKAEPPGDADPLETEAQPRSGQEAAPTSCRKWGLAPAPRCAHVLNIVLNPKNAFFFRANI